VSSAPFEVAVGRTARGIWKCKYFIEINNLRRELILKKKGDCVMTKKTQVQKCTFSINR